MSDFVRDCHSMVFDEAYNGLSVFLTEYPHMNEEQKLKIRNLVKKFSMPLIKGGLLKRPAISCDIQSDWTVIIEPKFLETS